MTETFARRQQRVPPELLAELDHAPHWKLSLRGTSGGLQEHSADDTTNRSGASDLDFQDREYADRDATDDLTSIRELAIDLLDMVNKDSRRASQKLGNEDLAASEKRMFSQQTDTITKEHRSTSKVDVNVTEAFLSDASTADASIPASPASKSRPSSAFAKSEDISTTATSSSHLTSEALLSLRPNQHCATFSPIHVFENMIPLNIELRPSSAASSAVSERKRRTRRSQASLSDFDTVDLRGLEDIAVKNTDFTQQQGGRLESAEGRVDGGRFSVLATSTKHNRKPERISTDMAHRRQFDFSGLAVCAMSPEICQRLGLPPGSVVLEQVRDGSQWDVLRASSRLASPTRPKSAGSAYVKLSESCSRRNNEPVPSTPGHRDRFAVSRGAPGPGAYNPVGFTNPKLHPTAPRRSISGGNLLDADHFHLKESAMKSDPGMYNVRTVAGNTSLVSRCRDWRSTPSCAFGREARVCTIAGGSGFNSRHVQRRGDKIAYDDIRMTVWRDWM